MIQQILLVFHGSQRDSILRCEWTELNQIWAGHRMIIDAAKILLDLRHNAPFEMRGT